MRTNPWKLASLALATATFVVAGAGFDRPAEATPQVEAIGAIGILESASRQLWRAPKDEHRQKAMEATRMAIAELRMLGFPTPPEDEPDPNGKKKKR